MTVSAAGITSSHGFKAPDATPLLNNRCLTILPLGVYGGSGLVSPGASGLTVTLAPFVVVGKDGVQSLTTAPQTFPVVAGITQRLVFRSVYNQRAALTAQIEVMSEAAYAADPQQDHLITFAQIVVPALATSVVASDIVYSARNDVDAMQRSPWRQAVATAAALPTPPTAVVRTGDKILTLDTLLTWTWSGTAWTIVDLDGLQNELDYRFVAPSQQASIPFEEWGRSGHAVPASPAAVLFAAQYPIHAALLPVGTFDTDASGTPAAIASRAQRATAGNVAYAKGRLNGGATVEAGDLRIGRIVPVTGNLVSTVQPGDPDVGTPIVSATFVVGTKDGLATYAYLKVGGNPLVVQATDVRLFLVQRNPARVGLPAGLTAVLNTDPDVGDTTASFTIYSTTAGSEVFYGSTNAALTAVTPGETNLRLTAVNNPSYAGKKALDVRSDRGYIGLSRPDGLARTGMDLDAGLSGNGFLQLWQGGVASGQLVMAQLASLIGGLSATHNPPNAGIATPVLVDTLHHHRDKARGDGVATGLAPSSSGGLNLTIASGTAFIGGELWAIAGASFTIADGTTNYAYIDGATVPTAPVLQLTTTASVALETPGHVPVAAAIGSGSSSISSLRDLRRNVLNLDAKVTRTIGADGQHANIQAAVDWLRTYLAAGQDPGIVEFLLMENETLSQPVSFAGVRGMVLRAAPGVTYPQSGGSGPAVTWSHNGPAFDVGGAGGLAGAADCVFAQIHFDFQGTVGTLANSSAIGNLSSGGTLGENVLVIGCTTQNQAGQPTNKLRSFVRCTQQVLGWRIENCTVDVTDVGIGSTGGFVRCKITGNIIKKSGTTSSGTSVAIGDLSAGIASTDCLIAHNFIHPPAATGIISGDGTGFGRGISFGVVTPGDRITAVLNQINGGDAAGTTAIELSAAHSIVEANTVTLSGIGGETGISCAAGSGQRIRGNTVSSANASSVSSVGIFATASQSLVEGNRVALASTAAVGIRGTFIGTTTGVVIQGNAVVCSAASGTTEGIVHAGNAGAVSNNFASVASSSGFALALAGGLQVVGNYAEATSTTGSSTTLSCACTAATLAGNQLVNLSVSGTALNFTSGSKDVVCGLNTVVGTTALLANGIGIGIDGTGHSILANTVKSFGSLGATNYAVTFKTTSAGVTFALNQIVDGILLPLFLSGTGNIVAKNQISANFGVAGDSTNGVLNLTFAENHVQCSIGTVVTIPAPSFQCKLVGNKIGGSGGSLSAAQQCLNISCQVYEVIGNTFAPFSAAGFSDGVTLRGAFGKFEGNTMNLTTTAVNSVAVTVVNGAADISISRNTITGTVAGILSVGGLGQADRVSFDGNTVNATIQTTACMFSGHGQMPSFSGNRMWLVGMNGATNWSGAGLVVDVGSGTNGFTANDNQITFTNGTTPPDTFVAVNLKGTSPTFSNSLLLWNSTNNSTTVTGVVLSSIQTSATVVGCTISIPTSPGTGNSSGIHLINGTATIGPNTITITGQGNGILITGSPSNVNVVHNTINLVNAVSGTIGVYFDAAITTFGCDGNIIGSIGAGVGIFFGGTTCANGHGNLNTLTGITTGIGLQAFGAGTKDITVTGNTANLPSGGFGFQTDVSCGTGVALGNVWTMSDGAGWATFFDVDHLNKAPT